VITIKTPCTLTVVKIGTQDFCHASFYCCTFLDCVRRDERGMGNGERGRGKGKGERGKGKGERGKGKGKKGKGKGERGKRMDQGKKRTATFVGGSRATRYHVQASQTI
jgi:hypothetical protein